MMKNYIVGMLMGILLIGILSACGSDTADYVDVSQDTETGSGNTEKESSVEDSVADSEITADIYVYVCGAVTTPGVYAIPDGSRICDLFALAGGLRSDAAKDYWNQARILMDGEMIYVPTIEEAAERSEEEKEVAGSTTGQTQEPEKEKKVNINTASKEELMTLPGIGESKADAILAYRERYGHFLEPEELMEIEGIKEAVFSKIKDYIVIN